MQDIGKLKREIEALGLREAVAVHRLALVRINALTDMLTKSLPKELQGIFGRRVDVCNLIFNGGCCFAIATDQGHKLSKHVQQKCCTAARTRLAPITEAWGKYGIVINSVYYLDKDDGVIMARLGYDNKIASMQQQKGASR